jgi:aquaporin Z
MPILKRSVAELLGTFWLVFGGCGSAVLAAKFPEVGIGLVGVSLAFGLTVVTMAYAVGHITGGHFNPAVTLGLLAGGRVKARGRRAVHRRAGQRRHSRAWLLATIASGNGTDALAGGLASNGFADHSPGGYSQTSAFTHRSADDVLLPAHHSRCHRSARARGFAPLAIGLALTLIHLISIPITNTSVNPARSTGPALMVVDGPFSSYGCSGSRRARRRVCGGVWRWLK